MNDLNQTSKRGRKLSLIALGLTSVAVLLVFLTGGPTESALPFPEPIRTSKKIEQPDVVSLNPSHSPEPKADPSSIEGQSSEIENVRRELAAVKVELARISKPLHEDILTSTVNATIRQGETLVTGGYMTADGNYELTLLTPRSVFIEGGREAIEVEAHILSVGPEFTKAQGLENLLTNARNTLQHAEAWTQLGRDQTLAAASGGGEAAVVSFPNVITAASVPFKMSSGEYSFEGTFAQNSDGGISIQSRIERSPKVGQSADGNSH